MRLLPYGKDLLNKKDVKIDENNATFNNEIELKMIERSGRRTVSQIFFKIEAIAGYSGLSQLFTIINLGDLIARTNEQLD